MLKVILRFLVWVVSWKVMLLRYSRFGREDKFVRCEIFVRFLIFLIGSRKYMWSLEEKLKFKVLI